MGIALIVALCGLIAQTPGEEAEPEPYTVRLRDGSTVHVLVRDSDMSDVSIEGIIDEPWRTGDLWRRIQRNEIQADGIEPELTKLREDRLRRGWLENGGIQVQRRSGGEMWVFKTEKEWADKAQAQARAAYSAELSATPVDDSLPAAQSHAGPGIAQLWAPHAAILAAAIALAAAVFLALLRPRERWQPLDSGNSTPRKH